jgi:hypothetical protein
MWLPVLKDLGGRAGFGGGTRRALRSCPSPAPRVRPARRPPGRPTRPTASAIDDCRVSESCATSKRCFDSSRGPEGHASRRRRARAWACAVGLEGAGPASATTGVECRTPRGTTQRRDRRFEILPGAGTLTVKRGPAYSPPNEDNIIYGKFQAGRSQARETRSRLAMCIGLRLRGWATSANPARVRCARTDR